MAFRLDAPAPNPFRGETSLRYAVPRRCRVAVKLYDISGREVKTLVDSVRDPGVYQAAVKGHDLSPGVYFCLLWTDGFVATQKLVLTR